jgi:hypothetical protein
MSFLHDISILTMNIILVFQTKFVYFQEIREFLVSEVKVLHASCVISDVEHCHDSRPHVTHFLPSLYLTNEMSVL